MANRKMLDSARNFRQIGKTGRDYDTRGNDLDRTRARHCQNARGRLQMCPHCAVWTLQRHKEGARTGCPAMIGMLTLIGRTEVITRNNFRNLNSRCNMVLRAAATRLATEFGIWSGKTMVK